MNKKILLFGASGFLGGEFHDALTKEGYIVSAPSHIETDIGMYKSLETAILKYTPDMIINAAARTDVDIVEKDPLPAWQINALAAGAIGRIIREHALATGYICMSSHYVFGDLESAGTEGDIPLPTTVYGATKALGETLVQEYGKQGVAPFYIIRASWNYSARHDTFIDQAVQNLRTGKEFLAPADQYGNPTAATELVHTIITEFADGSKESGIYHVVNSFTNEKGGVSRFETAIEIAAILGLDASLIKKISGDALFPVHRPSVMLRNTKLPPLRDWRIALREYLTERYSQIVLQQE